MRRNQSLLSDKDEMEAFQCMYHPLGVFWSQTSAEKAVFRRGLILDEITKRREGE